jgi:hypothetical protein
MHTRQGWASLAAFSSCSESVYLHACHFEPGRQPDLSALGFRIKLGGGQLAAIWRSEVRFRMPTPAISPPSPPTPVAAESWHDSSAQSAAHGSAVQHNDGEVISAVPGAGPSTAFFCTVLSRCLLLA